MFCSLLCLINFLSQGSLPDTRRKLYQAAIGLLAGSRDRDRGVTVDQKFEFFDLKKRQSLLQEIALTMAEGNSNLDDSHFIEVTRDQIKIWLAEWLKNKNIESVDAEDLLQFLVERTSILSEPGYGIICYAHRSIMEYLASNEIVLKRKPYTLQSRIRSDRWWSIIQFCIDTEKDGSYFAGELISCLVDYALSDNKNRLLKLRVASLLSLVADFPERWIDDVDRLAHELLPPNDNSEVEEVAGFPPQILEKYLGYHVLQSEALPIRRASVATILAANNVDDRIRLIKGYEEEDDIEILRAVNNSSAIPANQHPALLRAVAEGRYRGQIKVSVELLQDRNFAGKLANCPLLIDLSNPPQNQIDNFPFLNSSEIDLHRVTPEGWLKLQNSLHGQTFKNVRRLKITRSNQVTISFILEKFPQLDFLHIQSSRGIVFDHIEGTQFRAPKLIVFEDIYQSPDIYGTMSSLENTKILLLRCYELSDALVNWKDTHVLADPDDTEAIIELAQSYGINFSDNSIDNSMFSIDLN